MDQTVEKLWEKLHWRWIWVGLAVLLAFLLYGRGLYVPFYMDDMPQIPWAYERGWADLWTQPHFYGTYRPVGYSLYKLFITFQGDYDPFPLKFFNLALHLLDGLLAGQVAMLWWGREKRVTAFAATLCFIGFPYAYQGVPWPGCVFHLLVTAYTLTAILLYDRMQRGGSRWWAAAITALVWLGPLTHEQGYLILPLLALAVLRGHGEKEYEGIPYWLVGAALGVVVLFLLRQQIPGALTPQDDFSLSTPENLFQNLTYLLQIVTYPTALISGALAHRAGLNDFLSVWLVALPTLAVSVWAVWPAARRKWARWLTALAWPLAASSILMLFVGFGTLLDTPRQFTLTSAGIALLWAGVLVGLVGKLPSRRRVYVYVLLALLVVPGLFPVKANIDHLVMLAETMHDIAEAGRQVDPGDPPLTFVNLPAWTAHDPPPYALGHFGTMLFSGNVIYSDHAIYITSQKRIATRDVMFSNLLQPVPYAYTPYSRFDPPDLSWGQMAQIARTSSAVYLTRYEPDRVYLLRAGSITQAGASGAPVASFESGAERIELLAAEPLDIKGKPGLRLVWAILEGFNPDLEIFVHLYDAEGALVSQADGPFLMGLYPMWNAAPGDRIEDYRRFDAQPVGAYTLGVGLYDPNTGARAPAADARGAPLPDGMLRLEVAP